MQQDAGASTVGYTNFYNYKNYQTYGNEKFSGSKADREFWTHDTLDVEKDILKMHAHHKLLLQGNPRRVPKGNGSSTAAQNSFLSLQLPSKTKRNRCQRQAYNKRRKAKAAQQSAASKPATTPAPVAKKPDP